MIHKLVVILNGSNENVWRRYQLRCNPFPQIAKREWQEGMLAISELDGEPLKGPDDIRERLRGRVADELIELCVDQFRPGERVAFDVTFEGEQA
jgi:hypothetical protein